jgi:hypothetical protein
MAGLNFTQATEEQLQKINANISGERNKEKRDANF